MFKASILGHYIPVSALCDMTSAMTTMSWKITRFLMIHLYGGPEVQSRFAFTVRRYLCRLFLVSRSPFAVHRHLCCLFLVRGCRFLVRRSRLPVSGSPFAVRGYRFLVLRSPFAVRGCRFLVRRSPFPVRGCRFLVRRSRDNLSPTHGKYFMPTLCNACSGTLMHPRGNAISSTGCS